MTEAVQLEVIVKRLPELEALCRAKLDAADAFDDVCEDAAKLANIEPSVLKTYVSAVVSEQLEKQKIKAEQLSLLFDELPG